MAFARRGIGLQEEDPFLIRVSVRVRVTVRVRARIRVRFTVSSFPLIRV